MIAKAVRNTGASLGPPARAPGITSRSEYHVQPGTDYIVVGMGLFGEVLYVLIRDEDGDPNWHPIGLFEVSGDIPPNWEFALYDGLAASGGDASNRWVARWGYHDLVQNPAHSDALLERDPVALHIFDTEYASRTGDDGTALANTSAN